MMLLYYYTKFVRKCLMGKAIFRCRIHKTSAIGSGSNIVQSTFDKYSYCGYDCQILNSEIGSFCSISDHVLIGGAEHPMDWASTSPVFQDTRHSGPQKRFAKINVQPSKRTYIGSDVWIGHGATIKAGVTIGHGAVVGSNALVTKDVPPYAVVGGVPAKVIRYRFDDRTISALLESEWWTMSDKDLKRFATEVKDPELFAEHIISFANRMGKNTSVNK